MESVREIRILVYDFLIALFAFWLSRYLGDLPRWYYLVISALFWVTIGTVSGKLRFGSYKRVRFAVLGIFVVNVLSAGLLYLYYHFIPGYEYNRHSIAVVIGVITVLEWGLYYAVRRFVYRKIPFFYEEPPLEEGCPHTAANRYTPPFLKTVSPDYFQVIEAIQGSPHKEAVLEYLRTAGHFTPHTVVLNSDNPEAVLAHKATAPLSFVIHTATLNRVRHINTLLSYTNYCLQEGGTVFCHCMTTGNRREKIFKQNPVVIKHLIYFLDYCWSRIIPKLPLLSTFYFWITQSKNRALTRVEVLGRLYRAGFDVLYEEILHGEFYVIATKIKAPIRDDRPSNGLLIRLKRTGKNGKIIGVYKFRTMHAYSEYLQPYIYKQNGLQAGGKLANDFRVNLMGRVFRKCWLDELPMLINWLKGDLKLVGVRPLSAHYFSLYTKELQELRIKTKPGLLPPFYADMPTTLAEIQESELRYLQAYLQRPFLTDWRYFWKAIFNILLKGKRSK